MNHETKKSKRETQLDALVRAQDGHVVRLRAGLDGESALVEIERIAVLAADTRTTDGTVESHTLSSVRLYVASSRLLEQTIGLNHPDEAGRSAARIDLGQRLKLFSEESAARGRL